MKKDGKSLGKERTKPRLARLSSKTIGYEARNIAGGFSGEERLSDSQNVRGEKSRT